MTAAAAAFTGRCGALAAASAAARRMSLGLCGPEELMGAIAGAGRAGWALAVSWRVSGDDDERAAIASACAEAVRRLYVDLAPIPLIEAAVRRLETIAGMRDVIARWGDRTDSVALWRHDGTAIDLVRVPTLLEAEEAAWRYSVLGAREDAERMLVLLKRATCRTGCEVAERARSLDGVARALSSEAGDSPVAIARALVLARAEALASGAAGSS